jgi:iron(III) transport system substrate-binding protein
MRFCKMFLALVAVMLNSNIASVAADSGEVIVYTSQDQVYAEEVFALFKKETGIQVRAVFDSEAVKTAGLANRLIAESRRPKADVFWNNEEFHTRRLVQKGVLQTNWIELGFRTRQLVVQTGDLSNATPSSLDELTNSVWKGKVTLAFPLFGTTATHFLALKQRWGQARWELWLNHLHANKPLVVEGNSISARMVSKGEAVIGLTDSDDVRALGSAEASRKNQKELSSITLIKDGLKIPNTAALVTGSARSHEGRRFLEFLQQKKVQEILIRAGALDQSPETRIPAADWVAILPTAEEDLKTIQRIFKR